MVEALACFLIFVLVMMGAILLLGVVLEIMTNKRILPKLVWPTFPEPKRIKNLEVPKDDFQLAPIVQPEINGETVWRPIPAVESNLLTRQYIAVRIKCPNVIESGSLVGVKVDVSNNHPTISLRDQVMLILKIPTGAQRIYGPDDLEIGSKGDTASIFYMVEPPLIKGNYMLEFRLLKIGVVASKALVVR